MATRIDRLTDLEAIFLICIYTPPEPNAKSEGVLLRVRGFIGDNRIMERRASFRAYQGKRGPRVNRGDRFDRVFEEEKSNPPVFHAMSKQVDFLSRNLSH